MKLPYPRLLLSIFLLSSIAPHLPAKSALWMEFEKSDVQWRNWSDKTRLAAEEADKPLFFYVAYFGNGLARAMLNETFSNKTIAQTVNETSIPVLVDANQSPELASFLQRLAAEHFSASDFPICLWTSSQLAPLNGGGYFPPTDDWGGQGFLSLARNVSEQWSQRREPYLESANTRLENSLKSTSLATATLSPLDALMEPNNFESREAPSLLALDFYNFSKALPSLQKSHRKTNLTAMHAELQRIYSGAGFDSVEGGFFIGSNDADWRLPLFQKSTTDQALMLYALACLHENDPKPEYKDLAAGTFRFIRNRLTKENGLAIRILDSYSEGDTPETIEGRYYLVGESELETLEPATIENWGLDAAGNLDSDTDILGLYTKQNIPYQKSLSTLSPELDQNRKELIAIREAKSPLLSETTGYTFVNALIVSAYVRAGESFDEAYYESAKTLYAAILRHNSDTVFGPLFNSDEKELGANSLDYTYLIAAALDLYSVTSDKKYLDDATQLLATWSADERFVTANPIQLSSDSSSVIANFRDTFVPSAASVHLSNLKRLVKLGSIDHAVLLTTTAEKLPVQIQTTPNEYLSLIIKYKLEP